MTTAAVSCEWAGFIADDFPFAEFAPGMRVLDVGFGNGEQVRKLIGCGCRAFGIEYDTGLAARARQAGLPVCQAQAERLPFLSASLDGLVCKVVVPYTDEAKTIQEIARVLRPGGVARISYHGLGYSLRYLLTDPNWKRRVYGARTIANTWIYRLTGRRLPGFLGDTVYQAGSRLRRHYRDAGLELIEDRPAPRFAGAPVFIYHVVRRSTC